MAYPLVSVILSVYKPELYLFDTIDSVLNQTYPNIEFIIVDDGFHLSNNDIFSSIYGNRSLKVFSKFNSGLTDSLNYGISKSEGSLIARIDADDIWEINKIELQVNFLNQNKIALVGTSFKYINEKGDFLNSVSLKSFFSVAFRLKFLGKTFPHSSVLFNKSYFENLGGYRELFLRSQDRDLWLRFSKKYKVSYLDKPLTKIRKHNNQISSSQDQIFYSNMAKFLYFESVICGNNNSYNLNFFYNSLNNFPSKSILLIKNSFFRFFVAQLLLLYFKVCKKW